MSKATLELIVSGMQEATRSVRARRRYMAAKRTSI